MADQGLLPKTTKAGNGRIGFSIHLAVFVIVNALLIIINLASSPERLWFKWPLLGWGIGIACHGLAVFFFCGESSIRKRIIPRELKK